MTDYRFDKLHYQESCLCVGIVRKEVIPAVKEAVRKIREVRCASSTI